MQIESVLQTKNRSEPAKNQFSVALSDILKMCMKKFDAEKIFFNKLTGLLTAILQ